MRKRMILLIHECTSIREIIRHFLLAELADVELHEAATPSDAMERMRDITYDLVMTGNEMAEMSGAELQRRIRAHPEWENLPLLLITANDTPEALKKLKEQGARHCLSMPFTSRKLAHMVNLLCDPREWRTADRVGVSGARAVFHLANGDLAARIVNISLGGLLCDLPFSEFLNDLFGRTDVTLDFTLERGNASIRVQCEFLRLSVHAQDEQQRPSVLRAALRLVDLSDRQLKILEDILDAVMENQTLPRNETA